MAGNRPLVIAHRGGALEAPENTLAAFRRALEAGADGVECDVHATKDGVVFVHHDACVGCVVAGRTTTREIASLTSDELAAIDLGLAHGRGFEGSRAPTLAELLALCESTPAALLMVELKASPGDAGLPRAIASLLQGRPARDRCLFGSFSPGLLKALREEDPDLRLQGIAETDAELRAFEGLPLAGVALSVELAAARSRVAALQRQGLAVWTWTVKELTQVPALLQSGVDALITDRPRAVLAYLGRSSAPTP